jgi:hypothetical protein
MILTTLKIQNKSSFQDYKISISTFQNITLKRGANHQKMQKIQKMTPCLTSWKGRAPSKMTKNMNEYDTF